MTNSAVLKQVREQRHLELDDVASYVSISPKRMAQFEEGLKDPSFAQLEKLAEVYGVAPFAFAGDRIPNLAANLTDFRRTTPRPAHISPGGMRRIWSTEHIAHFAHQLQVELKFTKNSHLEDGTVTAGTPKAAVHLRETFDAWAATRKDRMQFFGAEDQTFLAMFRMFVESNGVSVIINDAPPEDYFGFYTNPDASTPLAFVNRKISSRKAQLFTLAHELCHHLLKATGISDPFRTKNDIERTCNQFAANFIAPASSFTRMVERLPSQVRRSPDALIAAASKQSLLSALAAAVRLRETDFLSQKQVGDYFAARGAYSRKEKDDEKDPNVKAFAPPHATAIGRAGYLPVYLAAVASMKKLVDDIDVQNGLGLSRDLQEGAFGLAKRRFEVALSK